MLEQAWLPLFKNYKSTVIMQELGRIVQMCLCISTAEREMGLCCGQGKTPNSPGTWKPQFLNSSSNNDPQGFGLSGRNAFWLLSLVAE